MFENKKSVWYDQDSAHNDTFKAYYGEKDEANEKDTVKTDGERPEVVPVALPAAEEPPLTGRAAELRFIKTARRAFSRVGWSFFVLCAVSLGAQVGAVYLVNAYIPELVGSEWHIWLLSVVPLYVFAMPACRLILGRMRHETPKKSTMSFAGFLRCLCMSISLTYIFNLLTTGIISGVSQLLGYDLTNPLNELVVGSGWLPTLIFAVICAPVMEELFFRKLIIDRLSGYGEGVAIIVSGVMFGLFHGNLFQSLYAVVLGIFFAYVYTRTGKLRHTIFLHMGINCFFSLMPILLMGDRSVDELVSALTQMTDLQSLIVTDPWLLPYCAYSVVMIALVFIGGIMLLMRLRSFRCRPAKQPLPKGMKFSIAYLNSGMVFFVLACLAMFAASMVQL